MIERCALLRRSGGFEGLAFRAIDVEAYRPSITERAEEPEVGFDRNAALRPLRSLADPDQDLAVVDVDVLLSRHSESSNPPTQSSAHDLDVLCDVAYS